VDILCFTYCFCDLHFTYKFCVLANEMLGVKMKALAWRSENEMLLGCKTKDETTDKLKSGNGMGPLCAYCYT